MHLLNRSWPQPFRLFVTIRYFWWQTFALASERSHCESLAFFLNVFLLLIRLYPKEIHEEMEQREVRQCCAAARWSFEIAGAVRYVVRLTQWLPTLRLIQTYSDSIHWRELFLCNFYRALSWPFEGSSRCYMCLPVRFGWVLPRNRESMAMWVWDDESSEILAEPFHQCWKATDATA